MESLKFFKKLSKRGKARDFFKKLGTFLKKLGIFKKLETFKKEKNFSKSKNNQKILKNKFKKVRSNLKRSKISIDVIFFSCFRVLCVLKLLSALERGLQKRRILAFSHKRDNY
ncbi:MAG: hypothetical protein LBF22_04020 [Deltaproteobacteria bacterium]|jgi:hypothetical protein|nr:hypothetical protein [Deltaproteobacteria bacterium]